MRSIEKRDSQSIVNLIREHKQNNSLAQTRLLLVEDDPIIRKAHCTFLTHYGYKVDAASCGLEALELCRNSYDVILIDINLPDMTGFQFITLAKLRYEFVKHVPVVALTTLKKDEIARDCQIVGVREVFNKPVNWDALCAYLLTLLGHDNQAQYLMV